MSATATASQLVNVQINGKWLEFPKGTKVIEACRQAGSFIPHYCYHPKLSTPGNCRMCLIEMGMPKMTPDRKPELGEDGKPLINWIPRPQISCAQDVAEGMAVKTDSPMVEECRQGVMEFLLINHPLDCPICDQAGECRLQEFSVEYGNAGSRFRETKVTKPKNVEIGPRIRLDDERCILCSRCIRFMKEVAQDDVLGFVNRGSQSVLTCHPGRNLDSNYSLNTVDICPVGALTSNDFRFKMRVWFLKETKSICTSCSTGCNTLIGSRENTIYRQTPRDNSEVNDCWMCDYGRLNYGYLHDKNRFVKPHLNAEVLAKLSPGAPKGWATSINQTIDLFNPLAGSQIAILASAKMTNEELFLTKKLADALGTELIEVVPHMSEGDDILLSADRNPNVAGAKLLGLTKEPGARLASMAEGIRTGKIKGLLVLHEDAGQALGLSAAELKTLSALVCVDILPNSTTEVAHVVLPGSGFAEKRGSMINRKQRLQRLGRAISAPGEARDDWEILRDLILAKSGSNGLHSVEDVFKQMASEVSAFQGLTLTRIGDQGVQL
ncbi:MAG: molybdopterin-dependent oxidoreductase [Verrucomicrobiales bacterium]